MGHSVPVMQKELAVPLMILLALNIFHCQDLLISKCFNGQINYASRLGQFP